MKNLYGREKLTASFSPEELNEPTIRHILSEVLPKHVQNVHEMLHLEELFKGNHPILQKQNTVRPNINHIVVENFAYQIVEFKKNYVHGNPLSYVQVDDADIDELESLTSYLEQINKASLDKDLGEDRYKLGTGFRICLPKSGDIPFEIYNLDPLQTNVVYSTSFRQEKLFGFTMVKKKDLDGLEYRIISVYTKNRFFKYSVPVTTTEALGVLTSDSFKLLEMKTHVIGSIPIIEYELNKDRISVIELVETQLNALNHLTSFELDSVDQFVQSLLVFVNAQITKDQVEELSKQGAVSIKSTNSLPADVKLLFQNLDNTNTKVLYDRIHRAMCSIVGIPIMSDKNASGGDTGQARMVGEGWTMADERAKQDEYSFEKGERELIDIILRIVHMKGELNTIQPKNIQVKFNRTRSDNLQTKTQALQMLLSTKLISPDDCIRVVELWSNPLEVYQKGQAYHANVLAEQIRHEQELFNISGKKEEEKSQKLEKTKASKQEEKEAKNKQGFN